MAMGDTLMSLPIEFQVAREIGTNLSKTFQQNRDEHAIDRILKESMASNDPSVLQNNIGQILSQVSPERQSAAIQFLQNRYSTIQEQQQQKQQDTREKEAGLVPGINPTAQAAIYKESQKGKRLEQFGLGGQPGQVPQGTQQPGVPQPTQSPFKNLSEDQLVVASGAPDKEISEPAKQELKRRQEEIKSRGKSFEADRTFHSKTSEPSVAAANEILKKAPIRKGLINQQRRDIASGNTEGILPFLAEKTGVELWRNPESARFKTASKQRFIENLSSIGGGARPNMFIEQQLVGAQAALGRDAESNQTVLDMEEFIDDLESQRARYIREAANEDREKLGYVRNDVEERADEKMEKYAEQRQDEMAYDIRKRREQNLSDEQLTREIVGKHVVTGTPLTVRAARILMIKNNYDEKKAQAEAVKLGFKIPTESTYQRG